MVTLTGAMKGENGVEAIVKVTEGRRRDSLAPCFVELAKYLQPLLHSSLSLYLTASLV